VDLESFRRWFHSDEFPEAGRICYLNGEVWVDMSKEQLFSHNQVRGEFGLVLTGLVKAGRLGRFVPDGMLLTNEEADFSAQPDGALVSYESLETGRIRLVQGVHGGVVELKGTPDMVLEVLSTSSVEKDTITQLDLYWRAGIREY
jgi:Uma2 family endonuclease